VYRVLSEAEMPFMPTATLIIALTASATPAEDQGPTTTLQVFDNMDGLLTARAVEGKVEIIGVDWTAQVAAARVVYQGWYHQGCGYPGLNPKQGVILSVVGVNQRVKTPEHWIVYRSPEADPSGRPLESESCTSYEEAVAQLTAAKARFQALGFDPAQRLPLSPPPTSWTFGIHSSGQEIGEPRDVIFPLSGGSLRVQTDRIAVDDAIRSELLEPGALDARRFPASPIHRLRVDSGEDSSTYYLEDSVHEGDHPGTVHSYSIQAAFEHDGNAGLIIAVTRPSGGTYGGAQQYWAILGPFPLQPR